MMGMIWAGASIWAAFAQQMDCHRRAQRQLGRNGLTFHGERSFDFPREVAVMAIIEPMPDSLFGESATFDLVNAIVAVGDELTLADFRDVPFGRRSGRQPR